LNNFALNTSAKARAPIVVVVVPALNEAPVIAQVVRDLLALRHGSAPVIDRVLVCDNGSTDDTARLALSAGAIVVPAPRRGYGAACLAGLSYVQAMRPQPDIVVFADGDGSVITHEANALIDAIVNGSDLVIGVRVRERQAPGALTLPQRVGNRVASWLIYALWGEKVNDLGPFRAIRTRALWSLKMRDETFGWTVEMQVKALQARMKVSEVSVSTRQRVGKSKISGTLSGVVGAARGIIGKIVALKLAERVTETREPSMASGETANSELTDLRS
jgi:glycosyltransferase involved in cell wall biosynthesis